MKQTFSLFLLYLSQATAITHSSDFIDISPNVFSTVDLLPHRYVDDASHRALNPTLASTSRLLLRNLKEHLALATKKATLHLNRHNASHPNDHNYSLLRFSEIGSIFRKKKKNQKSCIAEDPFGYKGDGPLCYNVNKFSWYITEMVRKAENGEEDFDPTLNGTLSPKEIAHNCERVGALITSLNETSDADEIWKRTEQALVLAGFKQSSEAMHELSNAFEFFFKREGDERDLHLLEKQLKQQKQKLEKEKELLDARESLGVTIADGDDTDQQSRGSSSSSSFGEEAKDYLEQHFSNNQHASSESNIHEGAAGHPCNLDELCSSFNLLGNSEEINQGLRRQNVPSGGCSVCQNVIQRRKKRPCRTSEGNNPLDSAPGRCLAQPHQVEGGGRCDENVECVSGICFFQTLLLKNEASDITQYNNPMDESRRPISNVQEQGQCLYSNGKASSQEGGNCFFDSECSKMYSACLLGSEGIGFPGVCSKLNAQPQDGSCRQDVDCAQGLFCQHDASTSVCQSNTNEAERVLKVHDESNKTMSLFVSEVRIHCEQDEDCRRYQSLDASKEFGECLQIAIPKRISQNFDASNPTLSNISFNPCEYSQDYDEDKMYSVCRAQDKSIGSNHQRERVFFQDTIWSKCLQKQIDENSSETKSKLPVAYDLVYGDIIKRRDNSETDISTCQSGVENCPLFWTYSPCIDDGECRSNHCYRAGTDGEKNETGRCLQYGLPHKELCWHHSECQSGYCQNAKRDQPEKIIFFDILPAPGRCHAMAQTLKKGENCCSARECGPGFVCVGEAELKLIDNESQLKIPGSHVYGQLTKYKMDKTLPGGINEESPFCDMKCRDQSDPLDGVTSADNSLRFVQEMGRKENQLLRRQEN
eukprot:g666.t1